MSKLEPLNKYIKNSKIDDEKLLMICNNFVDDMTASNTANNLSLSRQTINSYYKIIRTFLVEQENMMNKININEKTLQKDSFSLKYFFCKDKLIYYIELDKKIYLINKQSRQFSNLINFIDSDIEDKLINHKRANCARIIYNIYDNNYFVSSYLKSSTNFDLYIQNRLKKFRGINKNNYITHIKESIIRYNTNKNILLTTIKTFFNI